MLAALLPTLRSSSCRYPQRILPHRCHHLPAGLTQLQELSLQGCRNISGQTALHGLQQLKQLQVLGLRNCDGLTDGALEPLKALTGLVSLDLSGCQQLSGQG